MEWVNPEWSAPLNMSIARISSMYDEEKKQRLGQNVVNGEQNFKILG